MRTGMLYFFLLACLSAPTGAEVTSSTAGGFTVEHEVLVRVDRASAYAAAVDDIGTWWSNDHTISGDASRLRLEARAMGCFCEDLGQGNAVVHLVVTFVNKDVIIRLSGGLGPLGLMGVAGNMTWEFFDAGEGATRMKWTYAVGGYRPGGLDAIALPVDYVIGEALLRLAAFLETGNPDEAIAPAPGD